MASVSAPDKRAVLYILSSAAFLGPLSQYIYSPSIIAVKDTFGTSYVMVMATMSAYSFALGLSQIVYGPLVDAKPARTVLIVGLFVYLVSSLAGYFSPTIEALLVLHALQALGIAATTVVAGSLIADLFVRQERARAMSVYQAAVSMGMILGPVVGSVIAENFGWRATFIFLVAYALAILSVVWTRLPAHRTRTQSFVLGNALLIAKNRATVGVALSAFLQYYCLANFLNLLAIVVSKPGFELSVSRVGMLMVPFTIGVASGSLAGGRYADRRGRRRSVIAGTLGALAACSLFAAVIQLPPTQHLLVPLAAILAGVGLCLGFNWPAQLSLMVEWYPEIRGTAVGFYNFLRFCGSATGAFAGGLLTDQLGVNYAFGAVVVVMAMSLLVVKGMVREPA